MEKKTISIQEELSKLDRSDSDKFYDLRRLYESVNLSVDKKKELAKMLVNESVDSKDVYDFLREDNALHPIDKSFKIIETKKFSRSAKEAELSEEDIKDLKKHLKDFPPRASLGAGLFKADFTPKNTNLANGEQRVIYFEFVTKKAAYLLLVYKKNAKKDITKDEFKMLKKIAKKIKDSK